MLNRQRTILVPVCCLMILCLGVNALAAISVAINVAAKSGTRDGNALSAKSLRIMKDQIGVHVENPLLTAQQVSFKFDGLKNQDYDVYINGVSAGAMSAEKLSQGIEETIPGTVADTAAMRCLNALNDKIKPVYSRVHAIEGAEPWRAAYTLGQAEEWVTSGIRADQNYRSVDLVIVPAGQPTQKMVFVSRLTAENTAKAILNSCKLLHQARTRMYGVITDATLRNEVVDALTPVSLTASCTTKSGKPVVTAKIVNDSDLVISGKISLSDVKGWKAVGGKLDIGKLQPGKTFSTSFSLAPAAKNAPSLKSVPLTAVVDIGPSDCTAKLWLFATPTIDKK